MLHNYITMHGAKKKHKIAESRYYLSLSRSPVLFCNAVILFNVHGSVHRKNILIYVQQDATLHSLFYLETALHISGGTTTHH
jgi:hypothetical protein